MYDLTPIFQAVLGLIATLLTVKLLPWIKSKTSEQHQKILMMILEMLVRAAEQIFGEKHGDEKLEYVCSELRERGYEADTDMIEAAVWAMNNTPATMVYQVDAGSLKDWSPEQL